MLIVTHDFAHIPKDEPRKIIFLPANAVFFLCRTIWRFSQVKSIELFAFTILYIIK
jgi:hypothetical protein